MIYFDNNATTAIKPRARQAVIEALALSPLNPSSVHASGRAARKIIEHARAAITAAFSCGDANIIFTSGGTEANNLAVRVKGYKVAVSAIEHSSILKSAINAHIIPVLENGLVNLPALERILKNAEGKMLVSVMLANNETGVIQPIKEIAEMVHSHDGIIHTDAVQAAGKIPVDMHDLHVDMMSVSSHKFGGPQGAGALIVRKGIAISPIILGGGQEFGLRAGTENVAGIAGFGAAIENLQENLDKTNEIKILRDYMEKEIKSISAKTRIFGENALRLPNTSCFTMSDVKAEVQLIEFDLAGIALSSGSACSSGKITVSHVLQAMGVVKEEAETAIRVSLGIANTKNEADKFIETWKGLYERAGRQSLAA